MSRITTALLALSTLYACSEGPAYHTIRDPSSTVAVLNGTTLSTHDVVERATQEGISPREALDLLIEEELLYQHSVVEGFSPSHQHSVDTKRLAVHALLREVVEQDVRLDTLDETVVREQSAAVAESRSTPEVRSASVVRVPFGDDSRPRPLALEVARHACERLASAETIDSLRSMRGNDLPQDTVIQDAQEFRSGAEGPLQGTIFALAEVGAVSSALEQDASFVCARLESVQAASTVAPHSVADEVRQDYLRHERTSRVIELAQAAERRFGVERHEDNIEVALSLSLEDPAAP